MEKRTEYWLYKLDGPDSVESFVTKGSKSHCESVKQMMVNLLEAQKKQFLIEHPPLRFRITEVICEL